MYSCYVMKWTALTISPKEVARLEKKGLYNITRDEALEVLKAFAANQVACSGIEGHHVDINEQYRVAVSHYDEKVKQRTTST